MSEERLIGRLQTLSPTSFTERAAGIPQLPSAGDDSSSSRRAATRGGIWERQIKAWKWLGPPLRPSPEDVAEYEATVSGCPLRHRPPTGLVLGTTPELSRLSWPPGSTVLAVDRSPEMLRRIWPGHPEPGQGGVCADWRKLPVRDRSCDIVLGDGLFTQLIYPAGYREVARSIRRVLTAKGIATIRFFVRPEASESPDQVFSDLWCGRIGSFHAFKWRLAMALQEEVRDGVQLRTIWEYWADAVNPRELADRLGWRPEAIATIENYRGLTVRYAFPTLDELRRVLGTELDEVRCRMPQYELGERCPILTLRSTVEANRASRPVPGVNQRAG
jgi:hypothetical protein